MLSVWSKILSFGKKLNWRSLEFYCPVKGYTVNAVNIFQNNLVYLLSYAQENEIFLCSMHRVQNDRQ